MQGGSGRGLNEEPESTAACAGHGAGRRGKWAWSLVAEGSDWHNICTTFYSQADFLPAQRGDVPIGRSVLVRQQPQIFIIYCLSSLPMDTPNHPPWILDVRRALCRCVHMPGMGLLWAAAQTSLWDGICWHCSSHLPDSGLSRCVFWLQCLLLPLWCWWPTSFPSWAQSDFGFSIWISPLLCLLPPSTHSPTWGRKVSGWPQAHEIHI